MEMILTLIYIGIAASYVKKWRPTAFTFTSGGKLAVDVLLTLGAAFTIVPVLFCLTALKTLCGVGLGCLVASRR